METSILAGGSRKQMAPQELTSATEGPVRAKAVQPAKQLDAHLYNDPGFPLVHLPMRLGAYSWVCARATVNPGVNVGAGAILALGAIATRDLEPFGIYAGVPAKKVKERLRSAVHVSDEGLFPPHADQRSSPAIY